jgi:thiamine-phosphate pyrophosphorylase
MLYAITDRRLYGVNDATGRERLLEQAAVWAANGVAFIQLREKDLPARDQVELARGMLRAIHSAEQSRTRLLVNGRPDIALAAGADGVHLPAGADALTPSEVRFIFAAAGRRSPPIISLSCHTVAELEAAGRQAADCILFAPVFEKVIRSESEEEGTQKLPGTGLAMLQEACKMAAPIPVFALGGITAENAAQCFKAGAAGIAAIRLMQEPAWVWRNLK